jgi:hypothetical protein
VAKAHVRQNAKDFLERYAANWGEVVAADAAYDMLQDKGNRPLAMLTSEDVRRFAAGRVTSEDVRRFAAGRVHQKNFHWPKSGSSGFLV